MSVHVRTVTVLTELIVPLMAIVNVLLVMPDSNSNKTANQQWSHLHQGLANKPDLISFSAFFFSKEIGMKAWPTLIYESPVCIWKPSLEIQAKLRDRWYSKVTHTWFIIQTSYFFWSSRCHFGKKPFKLYFQSLLWLTVYDTKVRFW